MCTSETLADFSDVRRDARAAAVDAALARYVALLDKYCRAAPYTGSTISTSGKAAMPRPQP